MNKKQKRLLRRILIALAAFFAILALDEVGLLRSVFGPVGSVYASFALYLIPYLIAGYDVLRKAWRNIRHGEAFDESFLMAVATLGAFAMVAFPNTEPHMAEGAAVMLFYQVGELFQSYAVGKSRKSIAEMMDIAPEYANLERNGTVEEVFPDEIEPGSVIVIKAGERVPLDGIVVEGSSELNTAALTGESVPRGVSEGSEVISGCINLSGLLRVRTTKPYGESTVSRILELVENASEKKARTENFITRFARVYTPAVTVSAILLATLPPLLGLGPWPDWILRGLTFLVVSCPCALVISVPLSFFGGIGGASRKGILVKGSNYLEALSHVDTVVFDKTGTLTTGTFAVEKILPAGAFTQDQILDLAAHAEANSTHPIAQSVVSALGHPIDRARIASVHERAGHGVEAMVDGAEVLVGNDKLMADHDISDGTAIKDGSRAPVGAATALHVAVNGLYAGTIYVADTVKPHAREAIDGLHRMEITNCVMLTGDRETTAREVANKLGLDAYRAQLLPADKVAQVEALLANERDGSKLAFVGDGINDAPVLTRADVGIAMGAMGSDAAIEAADIVLMDDDPLKIADAIRIARKTMGIVRQNIVFAIGIKLLILALAAVGIANMWLAVFGDVGVAVIAILNAMRTMRP